jgi:hypothetical protein
LVAVPSGPHGYGTSTWSTATDHAGRHLMLGMAAPRLLELGIPISVLVINPLPLRALQSAAPTGVDDNYKHQHNDVDDRHLAPV